MTPVKNISAGIFSIILSLFLISFCHACYGIELDTPQDNLNSSEPQYVPNEVIVKFKGNIDPQAVLPRIIPDVAGVNRLFSIEPAVSKFKKNYTLQRDSSGWYAFLGKNYKETDDIPGEEIFKEAYKAMPDQEKSLYRTYKVKLSDSVDVNDAVNKLKRSPYVEYAEPNYKVSIQAFPQTLPNDVYVNPSKDGTTWSTGAWGQAYEDMWGLKKIQADKAWSISQGDGVVVAVIDTGVDYNHPDIAANMWHNADGSCGYNFIANNNNPMDDYGHGTHVAGTIAAIGNNSIGVIGVAPKAKIMAVKGLAIDGSGTIDVLAKCVTWAADNGANILSNSWGGAGQSKLLTDSFHYANSKGCICIASAGNNFGADVAGYYPAGIDTVIAVSASTPDDKICDFSNIGDKIEVSAPGGDSGVGPDGPSLWETGRNILSLRAAGTDMYAVSDQQNHLPAGICLVSEFNQDAQYYRARGTSMACPHVSGLIALVLSRRPNLNLEEICDILHASADDIGNSGKDTYFGYGRINAYMAVNLQISLCSNSGNNFYHSVANVKGSASMINAEDFYKYELYYASKSSPDNLIMITCSYSMVTNDVLGTWDTSNLSEGPQWLLVLKVTDKSGKTHTITKDAVVNNINTPPVFAPVLPTVNRCAVIGKPLTFTVQASDLDDPATPWGQLTYSVSGLPPGATFDPQTQLFSWLATDSNKGTYIVTFTVRDSQNVVDEAVTLSTVSIQEQEIGSSDKSIAGISMYGNNIIWEEGIGAAICVYDIAKNTTTQLPWQYEHSAAICNNQIALFANKGLYLYDCSTKLGTELVSFSAENSAKLTFYNNIIVYQDFSNPANSAEGEEIQMYDISTGQKSVIPNKYYIYEGVFKIYGDNIVVGDQNDADFSLYVWLYNISTKSIKLLSAAWKAFAAFPDIYDNKVVWSDIDANIQLYDINAGTQNQITDIPGEGSMPHIYKDRIVATNIVTNNVELYDLNAGQIDAHDCTDNSLILVNTAIYEDTIAFAYDTFNFGSSSAGWANGRIYMAKIYFSPIISSITPQLVSSGDLITITGSAFGSTQGTSSVKIGNDTTTTISSWSDTQIVCRVPNAQGGLVTVTTPSGTSNGINITILPATPSNLTATVVSSTQTNLAWKDNSNNEQGFLVERKTGAAGTYVQIANLAPNVVNWSNAGLTAGITYYYRIRAYNASGYSAYSNEANSLCLPGDANLDGTVGAADLNIVLSHYGKPGNWSQGDFNGDGTVGLADLNIVLSNYGRKR